jgi:hypothetical protein
MSRLPALASLLLATACFTDNRASRDRGTGLFDNVPTYKAPEVSRCEKFKQGGGARAACEEARYLAEAYVRGLSSPDDVCLEGGFGERPGRACQARASVSDAGPGKVLIEVRTAQPSSRWFGKEANQFWFEEGALVDLYLAEHGY